MYATTPEEAQPALTARLATRHDPAAWDQPTPYMQDSMTNCLVMSTQSNALILARLYLTGTT